MEALNVQALYELAQAVVAVSDGERVRFLLNQYEAGEVEFDELLVELRALAAATH